MLELDESPSETENLDEGSEQIEESTLRRDARDLPLSEKLRILGDEFQISMHQVADDVRELDNQPIVTMYGTTREHGFNAKHAELCYEISRALAAKGIIVASGGGSGVMKAINQGAYDQGADSIGILSEGIPNESKSNDYFTKGDRYGNFIARQTALNFLSNVVIVFPGGITTDFEEIYRLATLKNMTGMYPYFVDESQPNPIILVGKKFWQPTIDDMRRKSQLRGSKLNESMDSIIVTDDPQEVVRIAEAAVRHKQMREAQEQMDAAMEPLKDVRFSHRDVPSTYQGHLQFIEVTATRSDGETEARILARHTNTVDVVCPVIENGATHFLLENAYRPIPGGYLAQNIRGQIEPNETPAEAARRELNQEGGVTTYHDIHGGLEIYPASDLTTEKVYAMEVGLSEPLDTQGNRSQLSSELEYIGPTLSTNERGNTVIGLTKTAAIRAWTREGNPVQGRMAYYAFREGRLKGIAATEKGLAAGVMLSQLPAFKVLSSEKVHVSDSDPNAEVEITTIDRRDHFEAWKATRERLDTELRELFNAEEGHYSVPDYELSETDAPTRTFELLSRASTLNSRMVFIRPDGSIFFNPTLNFAAEKPEMQIPSDVVKEGETSEDVAARSASNFGFKVNGDLKKLGHIVNSPINAGRSEEIILVPVEETPESVKGGVWLKPDLAVVMGDQGTFHDLGTLVANEAVYDHLMRQRQVTPIQLGTEMDTLRKAGSRRNILGLRNPHSLHDN